MAMAVAGMFLFSACSNDDDPKEETILSELTTEEHKVNLENEGVAFIQNMEAIASLEVYDVMEQFMQLMDQQGGEAQPVYAPLKATLDQISELRNQPTTTINLKALNAEGDFALSDGFAEQAGIYTWEAATSTWTKEPATDQITYHFLLESEMTATISVNNFTYQAATNMSMEGFTVELLNSLNLSIKLDETELCSFAFTGEYHDNDTPKFLQEVFKLEGFTLTATFDLKDKKNLKTSGEFKYDETIILANGFEVQGNVDYDAIKTEMDNSANADGFPMNQEIVESTNAYFQIGNVKADALFNVSAMINAMNNVPEAEQTEAKMVELLNENAKIYIRYADSKEVIAFGEFYLKPQTETYWNGQEYVEETYDEMSMKMTFSDNTAFDESVFFDSGFSKMIQEINAMILAMNTNYGMELEGIEE